MNIELTRNGLHRFYIEKWCHPWDNCPKKSAWHWQITFFYRRNQSNIHFIVFACYCHFRRFRNFEETIAKEAGSDNYMSSIWSWLRLLGCDFEDYPFVTTLIILDWSFYNESFRKHTRIWEKLEDFSRKQKKLRFVQYHAMKLFLWSLGHNRSYGRSVF